MNNEITVLLKRIIHNQELLTQIIYAAIHAFATSEQGVEFVGNLQSLSEFLMRDRKGDIVDRSTREKPHT